MEHVGESTVRNEQFRERFNRESLLRQLVGAPDPLILDVGAHRGESAVFFRRLFPAASICSFEPDPDSFAALLAAAGHTGNRCFQLALSDADGTAPFFRNPISHTNSLLRVNADSRDSLAAARARAEGDDAYFSRLNQRVEVPTARLDTFVAEQGIGTIDLLKVDVQGAETRVLAGARAALRRTRLLVMEVSFFDYYERRTSFGDIESIVAPLGFHLFAITELSNNPMNGRTDWAEVVYLNEPLRPDPDA